MQLKIVLLNIYYVASFIFYLSGYIGHWTFTSLRDVEVPEEVKQDKDLPWWRKINLGEDKYRRGIGSFCFFFGKPNRTISRSIFWISSSMCFFSFLLSAFVIIFVGWTYILRSVKFLVAHKNGKDVSIVSYTPFGENRIMKVPIKCISAQESRTTAKTFLPLKVKNKSFFYILDMKGEFKNTKLYDQQIGLYRNF